MTLRTRLPVAVALLVLAACAGVQRQKRLQAELDAYRLPKPLEVVWPDALRLVHARGFELVGEDRARIGGEAQGTWGEILSRGYDTRKIGPGRWSAATGQDSRFVQYRIDGADTGDGTCRITYTGIQGDPSGGESHDTFRDTSMELELIEQLDPPAAERIAAAAQGGK